VAKRVAAYVAVVGRIRQLADSDAIEHNPDNSPKSRRLRSHLHLVQARKRVDCTPSSAPGKLTELDPSDILLNSELNTKEL
jgi:hypothetical protein